MPLALLLSPDDQAVSAITSVLEEMSVTCERPLDGASAAQKLNSNRFDLVLVDCENLAAAKLIFDVCRNRKGAGRPVPVAVVDGRAGLPTAFRLGAELILTKPVAKDQARITIRTAISRVKREDAVQDTVQADGASSTETVQTAVPSIKPESTLATSAQVQGDATDSAEVSERAFAAAAAANPSLTSFADPAPSSFTPPTPTPSMSMNAAVIEPEVVKADSTPKDDVASTTGTATANEPRTANSLESRIASRMSSQSAAKAPAPAEHEDSKTSAHAKPGAAAKPSVESEVKVEAKPQAIASAASEKEEQKLSPSEQKSEGSEKKQAQKSHGRVVTLVVLLLVCGGFYAAWAYEPGFQALAKSQINHLLVVLGMAPQPQQHPAPVPVKPVSQTVKPSAGVPALTAAPDAAQPSQPATTEPNAAPGATSSPASITPATTPASSSSTSTAAPAPKAGTPAALSPAAPSAAVPSATTIPTQPAPAQSKSGVTRIQLPPNAVEHPASPAGSKTPPPQH
jgi:DNA-binding response OmpR family regulator